MVVRLCVALLIFIASEFSQGERNRQLLSEVRWLSSQMDTLNTLTREILADVVQEANGGWFMPRGCNARRLRQKIWWAFWSHQGQFRALFAEDGPLEVVKTPLSESIYRGLSALDSPVLGGLGQVGNPMGTVLNLDGLIVGSDKFEHVFGFGYGFLSIALRVWSES